MPDRSLQPSAVTDSTTIAALERLGRLRAEFAHQVDGTPRAAPPPADAVRTSLRHHVWISYALLAFLVGGLGGWAATTNISGAVVASGVLIVDGGSKKVQHPDGGVVAKLLVDDEDHVTAGQLLVQLDGTAVAATEAIVRGQLAETYAEEARLRAEATGAPAITADGVDPAIASDAALAGALAIQSQLMAARADQRAQQKQRLGEQIDQLTQQIAGLKAQLTANEQSLDTIVTEDTNLTALFAKGLTDVGRLNTVKREHARLDGEEGRLKAALTEATSAIAEHRVAIAQVDGDFRTQVLADLKSAREKIAELRQQHVAALDKLSRLEIRAPQSGTVHELSIHTVGGVIGPGETLMLIVPENDSFLVEARVSPNDVDKVTPGQAAILKLPSLDPRLAPDLKGVVRSISPDLIRDPATNQSYYLMRVSAPADEIARLPQGTRLIPGMPVEAFAQTGDRTVLSYLLQPFTEQLEQVFRR